MSGKKQSKKATGDLVISIDADGMPAIRTDDNPLILNLAAFLTELNVATTEEALNEINACTDWDAFDAEWTEEGFSFAVGDFHVGTIVEMTFPFSMNEFRREVDECESSSTETIEYTSRLEDFDGLTNTAEKAGGVIALTMQDLADTCGLTLGSRSKIKISDRREIVDRIWEAGFTSSDSPSSRTKPILLWLDDSPIGAQLSETFPSVYETRPELRARVRTSKRTQREVRDLQERRNRSPRVRG